jgi:hypothetical protein
MGATMVGFLGASVFRRQAPRLGLAIAGLYLAVALGFVVYVLAF